MKKEPKNFIYHGSSYPGITTTKTKKGNRYSAIFSASIKLTPSKEEPLYGTRSFNKVKIRNISSDPYYHTYRVSGSKKKNVKNYLIANDLMED